MPVLVRHKQKNEDRGREMDRYHGGTKLGGQGLGRRCLFWSDTLAIEGSRGPRDREVSWRNYVRRPKLKFVGACFGQTLAEE